LGCDMTGAYITGDGGLSWRLFHLSGVVSAFAFDPSEPSVIYAANSALWRSEDAGRTWSLVFPDPAHRTVRHGWTDHADTVFTTEDPSYPSGLDVDVQGVAVDPEHSTRLAIALRSTQPGPPGSNPSSPVRVLVSEDRGRSFTVRSTFDAERVFTIVFERDGTTTVVADTGVYVIGETTQRRPGPSGERIESASVATAEDVTLIYATTRASWAGGRIAGGIHVSEDGGRTWRSANGTLGDGLRGADTGAAWGPATGSRPGLGPIATSARHGRVAYLGFRGLRLPGADGQANGIAKTTDAGRTWQIVHREDDRPSTNLDPSWIEARAVEDGHSVWFDAPYDLAVAPGEPDVAYATDLFRAYRTRDGGKTWAQVNSARRGDDRWTSRGLDVTTNYGVHWDPFDARRVFVGWTDIGLFRSEDGGETWTGSSRGIPKEWRNTTYWLEMDPEVRGLAWGAFSGTHDLPRPKMWRRADPARYRGGVAISRDGGRTWTPSNAGLPESAITHLLLDPTSPAGHRRLWATAFGRGVYRSDDDGRTWALKNTGIEGAQPFAWRISRTAEGTLYLVVARRSERGRIGDAGDGALYRSMDGGEHWAKMALPAGTNGPNALTPDPSDSRRLYLSAWGVATPGGDTGGGIFLSTDAGATWRNLLPESQHVYDVTLDPRDPAVLYACGFDQVAWRSTDRGETWSRLRGFNFQWGHRVVPDKADPARVYVTTYGGSLWRGPAGGDPQALEDVVPWGERAARLESLIEANIAGTHAYQVLLARKESKGDPSCYAAASLGDDALRALEAHQKALLEQDPAVVRTWVDGRSSSFDPKRDVEPLLAAKLLMPEPLPVNVFTSWLAGRTKAPRAHVRAIANLLQTNLEVERDGDRLQELFRFYIGLGVPVYVGQLGLSGTDADFMAAGRELEPKSCASPVGTTAAEWQIALRKNWNWGEKNLGIRDAKVLAGELLAEADVAALVPRMRALPPQRIAVIGHSFTMDLHWSSPSSFVPVVTEMFRRENPKVEFRQFQGGGLTSTRARRNFYEDARAWKPDRVLLVVINRTPEDLEAFAALGRGFAAAGARVLTFDDVHDPDSSDPKAIAREGEAARAAGMTVIEVGRLLESSPDRGRFFCLDHVHMTEPYHRLMAKEWLKFLVGAREAALGRP
ncbi:MAG: hypothetical protein ACHQKZ_08310, partial [Solirubrobacterales bacterium]